MLLYIGCSFGINKMECDMYKKFIIEVGIYACFSVEWEPTMEWKIEERWFQNFQTSPLGKNDFVARF